MEPLTLYALFTIIFQLVPTIMLYSIDKNFFFSVLDLREPTLIAWAFAMQMLATFASALFSHEAEEAGDIVRKKVLNGKVKTPLLWMAKRGWIHIPRYRSMKHKAWDVFGAALLFTFMALSVRYAASLFLGRIDLIRFPTLMFASWLGFIAYPYRWIPVGDQATRLVLAIAATLATLYASAHLGDLAFRFTLAKLHARRLMKRTDLRGTLFEPLIPHAETLEDYLAYLEGGGDLNLLLKDLDSCVTHDVWGRAFIIAEAIDRFLKEMETLVRVNRPKSQRKTQQMERKSQPTEQTRETAPTEKAPMEKTPPKRTPMDDYVC
ncbi:MAG: hypothetical protein QW566_00135 [Candidatus Jordarchaeales archaeon]|nr:hypothetical protein [Candidatus Bathyarchaeota archaeon]